MYVMYNRLKLNERLATVDFENVWVPFSVRGPDVSTLESGDWCMEGEKQRIVESEDA